MAKIRKTASIENGLMEVLKILNEEEIKAAIGKGASYLRKCGDNETAHKLQFEDAIKLDLICFKKNETTPFFDIYK